MSAYLDRYRLGVQRVLERQSAGNGILFPKQAEILQAEAKWLSDPLSLKTTKRTGYYKVATGGGKTVLFSQIIDATRDVETNLPLRTLIVVPTKRLVTQTYERLNQFSPELDVSFVDGEFKEFYGDGVIVTTYDSLRLCVASGALVPDDFDLLILDEAHNALGPNTKEVIERFQESVIRGFTATPEYDDLKNLKGLLGHEIYNIDIPEAVHDGLLSSFKCILVHSTKIVDYESIGYGSRDYDRKKLERAINDDAVAKTALDVYLNYEDPETGERLLGKKLRLNCISVEHANAVAKVFNEGLRGLVPDHLIPAVAVHSKISPEEREGIDKKRLNGDFLAVTQVRCLDEGDDDPSLEVVFNLTPTMSKLRAEQRGGRALRLHPEYPDTVKYVADFTFDSPKMHSPPVLFAEIVGAAEVLSPSRKSCEPKGGGSGYYDVSKPDVPDYRVVSDVTEIAKYVQGSINQREEYEKSKHRDFIIFTEDKKAKILKERERTGLGAKNLRRYYDEPPKGLTDHVANNILNCMQDRVQVEHLETILKAFAKAPDARPTIEITDSMRLKLNNEMERTGVGAKNVLKTPKCPEGLSHSNIDVWRRTAKEADKDHWEWLIKRYSELPTVSAKIEYTELKQDKLIEMFHSTNAKSRQLARLPDCPEGLSASGIDRLKSKKFKTGKVLSDHLTWVFGKLADMPANNVFITDEKRAFLLSEKERTGIGSHKIRQSDDCPKGLSGSMLERWYAGTIKNAKLKHWNFIIQAYAALPDNTDELIIIDENRKDLYEKEKARTGVAETRFLNGTSNPYDLKAGVVRGMLLVGRKMNKVHWDWVIQEYKKLPTAVELTDNKKKELQDEIDRTGISYKKLVTLLGKTKPETLSSSMISGWLSPRASYARKEYWDLVMGKYEVLPDRLERISIPQSGRKELHQVRETMGSRKFYAALLGDEDDVPVGLDRPTIGYWLKENNPLQTAPKAHWEWALQKARKIAAEHNPEDKARNAFGFSLEVA